MGCFAVFKSKKKKNEPCIHNRRILPQEHTPTALPEPQVPAAGLQSSPPSFITRVNTNMTVQSSNKKSTSNPVSTLSAPSSLHGADRDNLSSTECNETEDPRWGVVGPFGEQRSPSPQPLPLPPPQTSENSTILKSMESFKSRSRSGPLHSSGPLPVPPSGTFRSFGFEEIASACRNFSRDHRTSEELSSSMYKTSSWDVYAISRKLDSTIARFYPSTQGLKEFVIELNTLATLQHPNLCKLLGYHAREDSEKRFLVYERLPYGSLDGLLYGKSDGPPVDWSARMKVALCAAQGLTFLHEEGPFQAMYREFSTANIQIDKDFSAKLSGYGCVTLQSEVDFSSTSNGCGYLSVETIERGLLTPKSNVYSFGIVLLELLTGRKNMDCKRPKEEKNLVKWSGPFLTDECRLSLIVDPLLKGRFPIKAARTVADIVKKCLQKDPSERPTMRSVVEQIKSVQDMKYACRFRLQEPGSIPVAGKQMLRSPSLDGIMVNPASSCYSYYSQSPSSRVQSHSSVISPTRPLSVPSSISSRGCSSLIVMDEIDREIRRSAYSSAPLVRRASVEGF